MIPWRITASAFSYRAFRRIEGWRLVLVLTPWMLSRLIAPSGDPGVEIPEAWRAEHRRDADYVLLGPKVSFELLQTRQTAHLNFHPTLGHYLLQPIALSMTGYASPDEVFQAWNHVIKTRDENMEKFRKDCPWQKEVSRREFFGRFKEASKTSPVSQLPHRGPAQMNAENTVSRTARQFPVRR